MRSKKIFSFAVFLFSLLMVSPLYGAEPIKIGTTYMITGYGSITGEPYRRVTVMIQEDLDKTGFQIGGRPVKFLIDDDESDPTKTFIAIKRQVEVEKVIALVGLGSTAGAMSSMKFILQSETPALGFVGGTVVVSPANERKWVFKTPYGSDIGVEKIFEYMKKKGITKVGSLVQAGGFGNEGREQILKLAPKFGIEVKADERFAPKDNDMTVQLTKIKASGAEAVICWTVGPQASIVAKNHKQLGLTIPLFQSHGVPDPEYIKLAGASADDSIMPGGRVLVVDHLSANDPKKVLLKEFIAKYEARWGKDSMSVHAPYAYDGILMLVEALKKVGPDKTKIRDYIENLKNFNGTTGTFNFSPDDHNGLKKEDMVLLKVKDGKWVIEAF
jgi:branched-chain amino acid transport system substrate-binding protein